MLEELPPLEEELPPEDPPEGMLDELPPERPEEPPELPELPELPPEGGELVGLGIDEEDC